MPNRRNFFEIHETEIFFHHQSLKFSFQLYIFLYFARFQLRKLICEGSFLAKNLETHFLFHQIGSLLQWLWPNGWFVWMGAKNTSYLFLICKQTVFKVENMTKISAKEVWLFVVENWSLGNPAYLQTNSCPTKMKKLCSWMPSFLQVWASSKKSFNFSYN